MKKPNNGRRRPQAVPTLFKGRIYRSRLEARVAALLDRLGVSVLYEQTSRLLPDHDYAYVCDWESPDGMLFVEARGRTTDDDKIEAFAHSLPPGARYVILQPKACRIWEKGEWHPLFLQLVRPNVLCPVLCEKSYLLFRFRGQKLDWTDLEKAVKAEKGTMAGASLCANSHG